MARIVGGCLSQFHNEPDSFELLLSYADGKEIGHVIDRGDAVKLTNSLAEELDIDAVGINTGMYLALKHLREAIAPDHVTLKGHTDLKAGALEVIDLAISRASPLPQAVMQSEAAEENIYELRKEGGWVRVTKKEWIEAERSAGFRPKLSSDHELYMKTCATSGFSGNNIEGRIRLFKS